MTIRLSESAGPPPRPSSVSDSQDTMFDLHCNSRNYNQKSILLKILVKIRSDTKCATCVLHV